MNEWVWSNGGMVLTTDNTSTWRETCWNATPFTTNLTWTDLGWNPGLHGDRPATNHLSHGKVFGIGQKIHIKPVSCSTFAPYIWATQFKDSPHCHLGRPNYCNITLCTTQMSYPSHTSYTKLTRLFGKATNYKPNTCYSLPPRLFFHVKWKSLYVTSHYNAPSHKHKISLHSNNVVDKLTTKKYAW